jgi:hypothetical protein
MCRVANWQISLSMRSICYLLPTGSLSVVRRSRVGRISNNTNEKEMDMSTQFSLLESSEVRSMPIHVVGVGGIGSNVAYMLAPLGSRDVHIHDNDTVSSYNWRNQRYAHTAAGLLKVIDVHSHVVGPGVQLEGVVFLCVDSMQARAAVYDNCIRDNPLVRLVIDTRISATTKRILTFDMQNALHRDMWNVCWHTDSEATNALAACGSPMAVGPTAVSAAADAVWQLVRYDKKLRGEKVFFPNDCTYDLELNSPPDFLVWE